MAISKLKQIKQIVKTHPVTDPRGALLAIADVFCQKNPTKKQKPVFSIDVFDHGDIIEVHLDGVDDVSPCHVRAVRESIKTLVASKVAEEDAKREPQEELDPEHKARIERAATLLAGLSRKFNEAQKQQPKVSDTDRNSTQGAD